MLGPLIFSLLQAVPGGSPGTADPDPPFGRVRINEILSNSDPPLEDAIEALVTMHLPGPPGVTIVRTA